MARHIRGSGRVFQRARSPYFWLGYYHNGRELRESTGLTAEERNLAKAEKMLKERTRQANTPQFIGPVEKHVTFADLKAWYLADFREQKRRSLRDAIRIMDTLERFFGQDRALAITSERLSQYRIDRKQEGVCETTINRELSAIGKAFTLAIVKHKKLTMRPYVPKVSEAGNEREGFLEPPDFKRLVAHLEPDVADVATFAYRSAWRRTEVLMLPWKDVSFERRQGQTFAIVKLPAHRTKTKKRRVLTIGPNHPLHDVLRRRQAARRLDCGLVFHRDGRPIKDFRKQWASACKAAGLMGTLFHDMRRSGVRNLVRAGVTQSVAMRVSGHKTQSVFQRYDIVSDGDLAQALDAEAAYVAEQEEAGGKIAVLNENADTSRTPAPGALEAGVA